MQAKNYYQILGVSPTSNSYEIKTAYRKLALQFHPDKNANDAVAEQVFKEINEAYDTLSDQQKRTEYHRKYFGNITTQKEEIAEQISSIFICEKMRTINKNLEHADPYRMNKDALMYQLQQLFSSYNLSILQKENNSNQNNAIIDETLTTLKFLSIDEQKIIIEDLKKLPSNQTEKMNIFLKKQQSIFFFEKYKMLLVLLATIIIILGLYFVIK